MAAQRAWDVPLATRDTYRPALRLLSRYPMAAKKGVDLDELFSFLSEEQQKSAGSGKDEEQYLSTINQDLDKMIGDEVRSSASGGGKRTVPAGKTQAKAQANVPPKQPPAAAKPEASKGKFKWKK